MTMGYLWASFAAAFAALMVAAAWFIRRDAQKGERLDAATNALQASSRVREIHHEATLQERGTINDFLRDRLRK